MTLAYNDCRSALRWASWYKRLLSSLIIQQPTFIHSYSPHSSPHPNFYKMQFFKSAVVAVLAFAAVAIASPAPAPGEPTECKPLLESCSVNSDCCADVCLAGVSANRRVISTNKADISITALPIDYADTRLEYYPFNRCFTVGNFCFLMEQFLIMFSVFRASVFRVMCDVFLGILAS